MKGVQEKLDDFSVVGVKPGFMNHEEEGKGSAFETIDQNSFEGKWKVIYFYPKDFTFVCPINEFSSLNDDFNDRDAVLMGGSDNEHCKLARRSHESFAYNWIFSIRYTIRRGYRTFIVDFIQHASVNNLNVGRNPKDTLRILDALQTDELCACNRPVGGETL